MSSSRLPGKVMADVCGEPMVVLMLRRLAGARKIGRTILATSVEPSDDPLAELIAESPGLSVQLHRGPLDDVLTRYVEASEGHPGPIARLTADCPLIDPAVVDLVIQLFERSPSCDYASNVEPRSFPQGLDVEVFSRRTLETIAKESAEPVDREHVTTAIRRQRRRFGVRNLNSGKDLGALCWSVDQLSDLEFVREVVRRLDAERYDAGMEAVLAAIHNAPSLEGYGGQRRG